MRTGTRLFTFAAFVCAPLAVAAQGLDKSAVTFILPERESPTLQLSKVVLYSSGVGYFQHDGAVEGTADVSFQFRTDVINDLLKSLIVQDFDGGQVSTVTYDSQDPIAKTLKTFAIDLTGNPSLGELLNQIRGEYVDVSTSTTITGSILGVESKQKRVLDRTGSALVTEEYLNLVTNTGLRSIPLDLIQGISLRSERLTTELYQALALLATKNDSQKKSMSLRFEGEGMRRVRVGYMMESPVWKASYRLVLDEPNAFLQGWAIVENTTDRDWNAVDLSLVSGRPISFAMDLYQPRYTYRPTVEFEQHATLRPQLHEDVMAEAKAPKDSRQKFRSRPDAKRLRKPAQMAEAFADMSTREERDSRLNIEQGVTAVAQGSETGELFEYAIDTPFTLARRSSAMVPIVNMPIEGTKLSIYRESVHAKHPLNGIRLRNTSSLFLPQGPMTLYDDGAYAGDARLSNLAPGQDRLISYALDLNVEVATQQKTTPQDVTVVSLRKGTLRSTRTFIEEKTYIVKNRDQKEKQVLIEHPQRADWTLIVPLEPTERTRDAYRFTMRVMPDAAAILTVREERVQKQTIQLTNVNSDTIIAYVNAQHMSPALQQALQQVVSLRSTLSRTKDELTQLEQRNNEITKDQIRIRENMRRLSQNAPLFNRYVTKLDRQETELEQMRGAIETLQTKETQQKQELDEFLMGLDLE